MQHRRESKELQELSEKLDRADEESGARSTTSQPKI